LIESEKRQHVDSRGQPNSSRPGGRDLRAGVARRVRGVHRADGPDTAEIRITFNPLVWWVWYGGMVMALGGLIVMWPASDRTRAQGGYAAGDASGGPSRAGRSGAVVERTQRYSRREFLGAMGAGVVGLALPDRARDRTASKTGRERRRAHGRR